MKKNFSIKLTAFLVSLFISLILVIVGNKNQYCLSFGFMLMGVSVALYVLYNDEKTVQTLADIDQKIAEIKHDESMDEDDADFSMQELMLVQTKLLKRKKKIAFIFYLFAALLVVLGFYAMF